MIAKPKHQVRSRASVDKCQKVKLLDKSAMLPRRTTLGRSRVVSKILTIEVVSMGGFWSFVKFTMSDRILHILAQISHQGARLQGHCKHSFLKVSKTCDSSS